MEMKGGNERTWKRFDGGVDAQPARERQVFTPGPAHLPIRTGWFWCWVC